MLSYRSSYFLVLIGLILMVFVSIIKAETEQDPLRDSAKACDSEKSRILLEQGYDVNGHNRPFLELSSDKAKYEDADGDALPPIHLAVQNNCIDVMSLLLDEGAEINIMSFDGTPLHRAVIKNDYNIAELLLKRGADPNIAVLYWGTPLHTALLRHNTDLKLFRLLLENGANPNAVDDRNERPLNYALSHENTEYIKLLLEKGADPNAYTRWGSYLHGAAGYCNAEAVKYFIAFGQDVNQRNSDGNTPLHLLNSGKDFYGITFMEFEKQYSDDVQSQEQIGLMGKQSQQCEDVAGILISKGADVNASNGNGDTPLHNAIKNCETETISLLVNSGADVNAENNYDRTPLHWASYWNQGDKAKLLIQYGAIINPVDPNKSAPLHSTLFSPYSKYAFFDIDNMSEFYSNDTQTNMLELLIENGADIEAVQPREAAIDFIAAHGDTFLDTEIEILPALAYKAPRAFMYALEALEAISGKDQIFAIEKTLSCLNPDDKSFLENQESITEKKYRDQLYYGTPFFNAACGDNESLIDLLGKHGAKGSLIYEIRKGNVDSIDTLLESGTDPNETCPRSDETPLQIAINSPKREIIITYLLEHGANPNTSDSEGTTPLHTAVRLNEPDIVSLLISHGADINAIDSNGIPPIFYSYNVNIREMLLNDTTDYSILTNEGESFMHLAARWGDLDLIKKLTQMGLDADLKTQRGETPLIIITAYGIDFVRFFITHGADLEVCFENNSPLIIAVSMGNKEIIDLLIKSGANINQVCNLLSPLHRAAFSNETDIIEQLMSYGADINIVNSNGQTPLQIAAFKNNIEAATILLSAGANKSILDKDELTPMDIASNRGNKEMVKLLMK